MSLLDERHGLPSASTAERLYHCAGSLALSAEAPKETPSAEAQQGADIHEAMESEDFSGLDEAGRTIAERLSALETQALDEWLASPVFREGKITIVPEREVRYWIRDRKTHELAGSAKIDVGWIGKTSALLLDLKTGYLPVSPAYRNYQARVQALAVWHEYPRLEHIRAGIASYRFRGKFDTVDYDVDSLRAAENEFFYHAWEARQPYAPRVPGVWCKSSYCPARSICPEANCYAMLPVVHTEGEKRKKADVVAIVQTLSLAQLAYLQERKSTIVNILDAGTDRLKGMSPEELATVGLQLVPSGNVRTIPDLQAMWSALFHEKLIDLAEFQSCLKGVVSLLEELLVEKLVARDGGTKKDALAKAKKLMEPAIELRPKAPTLKPLKADRALPEGE